MERLSSYEADRLNDALYGMDKGGVERTQVSARYVRTDPDGTAWVRFEGADKDTPLTSAMSVTAREGDLVDVRLGGYEAVGGGNRTDPSAGVARVALVENLARDTAEESAHTALAVVNAQQTADEANKVAQATNQHFFADDNGAHVTDVTQDEWSAAVDDNFSDYDPDTKPYHNQLLSSLGILLRTALNNLVSITRSAIAFYDGAGNSASNIVARFGADGAQIGKSGAAHLELTSMTIAENASREGADTVFKTGFANDPTTGIASVTLTSYITWTIRVDDVRYFIIYTDKITPLAFSSLKVDGVTYPTSYLSVHELTGDILLDYSTFSSKLYSEIEVIYTTDELVPTFFYGTASLTSYTRTGANSAALGHNARAFGLSSFALGDTAKAIGNRSFATGQNTTASGEHSSAIGNQTKTTAQASNSISAGYNSVASAMCAMALGNGVVSANMSEVVIGEYNDYANDTNPDGFPQHNNRGNYALIIGNGTSDTARSNAFAVEWDGTTVYGTDMSTTVVGDVISPASGITIGSVHCETWGRLASFYIRVTPSAAKSGSWDVGTLVPGLRPPFEQGAWTGNASQVAWLYPTGVVRISGTVAAGVSAFVKATYLLA